MHHPDLELDGPTLRRDADERQTGTRLDAVVKDHFVIHLPNVPVRISFPDLMIVNLRMWMRRCPSVRPRPMYVASSGRTYKYVPDVYVRNNIKSKKY